jgi:hypothetical protein
MKIRIKGNSLRYRLTRSDLSDLAQRKALKEYTEFGDQVLTYKVEITEEQALKATFTNQTITLYLSENMIKELDETDRVGFEDQSGPLHLLIEKDFTCLDNVAEDQSDNFPNPLAAIKNNL